MKEKDSHKERVDLSGLYPDLTPEELAEAEYNLTRYIDLVCRIYEQSHHLTASDGPDTLP